jgi:ribulose-phosphate 3-epimerase
MRLAPSLLAADLADLAGAAAFCAAHGADLLHLDVMDGAFVPNLTFGAPVLAALRRHTALAFDVHLMVEDPDSMLEAVLTTRPAIVSVHAEACRHLDRTLATIGAAGARRGVAINPATPVEVLSDVLAVTDVVVVMSVNPGFGGQRFLDYTLEKVRRLVALRRNRGLAFDIEMDGGLDLETLPRAAAAGIDLAVVGSALFGAPDPAARVADLLALCRDLPSEKNP